MATHRSSCFDEDATRIVPPSGGAHADDVTVFRPPAASDLDPDEAVNRDGHTEPRQAIEDELAPHETEEDETAFFVAAKTPTTTDNDRTEIMAAPTAAFIESVRALAVAEGRPLPRWGVPAADHEAPAAPARLASSARSLLRASVPVLIAAGVFALIAATLAAIS